MVTFGTLRVQAFRSFARKTSIGLRGTGLIYVAGRNEVEPALGANGAGKTTLFEALYWVLFGKTSRNLRASDVASWDSDKSTRVGLDFVGTDGKAHTVERTWNPVLLTIDESPATQAQLDALTGYSDATFLHAVFHAQFVDFFADLQPSRQLEVYTEVLGLDLWEAASDESAKRGSAEEKQAQAHAITVAGITGKLFERRRQLDDLEFQECDWWRNHVLVLGQLWKTLAASKTAHAKMLQKLRAEPVVSEDVTALNEEIGAAARDMLAKKKAEYAIDFRISALEDSLKALDKAEKDVDGMKSCPRCFQPVDKKTASAHIAGFRKEAEEELAVQEELVHQAKTARQASVAKADELAEKKEQLLAKRNAVAGALQESVRQCLVEVKRLERTLEDTVGEACPYDSEYERDLVEKTVAQLVVAKNALKLSQQQVSGYEFWAKAFREIRLALIKSSLAQFEVSTNSALQQLGLEDWAIEYAVEAETKTGKLKRGFSIAVRSPYNDGPVPFTTWSGGEAQRLRLAIAFGLSDLIQDFSGAACNLEIFDEPTAHLSENGIQALLSVLEERAQQRNTGVWLVDHHVLDYGGFSSIIQVCKNENGSQIE